MNSFFNIEFMHWGHYLQCETMVDKEFDYYVLNYAASGFLNYRRDTDKELSLKGPVAWITYPGPRFQFGKKTSSDELWEHYYVAFRGSGTEDLISRGLFAIDNPIIPIYDHLRLKSTFTNLINYLEAPRLGFDRAAIILEDLLLQLHEQTLQQNYVEMDSRIKTLTEKIIQAPGYNWDFRVEAKKMGLSFSHFRKLFCEGMTSPPTLFLISERMKLAANLLKKTSLTLSEVAEKTAYDDIYYFNKSFKKYHGKSPGKYRKESASLFSAAAKRSRR